MRKWHRRISIFFGAFLLWIAATGVASQIVPLLQGGEDEHEEAVEPGVDRATLPPPVPGFVCPANYLCRPREQGRSVVGFLHHLHSGEEFGPIGVTVSILSGLALLFFSGSGLWMYVVMWRNRKANGMKTWLW